MALKSTVFKALLSVSDLDRGYYGEHSLTLARHPSETDERLMVRLLAFALHAGPGLEFGRGLSTADEPALWQHDATGRIELWIEVGLPDPRVLRRAAGRADRLVVYTYGGRAAGVWWSQNERDLSRLEALAVYDLPAAETAALAGWAGGRLDLSCTVQDGTVHLATPDAMLTVEPETRKAGPRSSR